MNQVKQIELLVCNEFKVTPHQIKSRSLNRQVTLARFMLFSILRRKGIFKTYNNIRDYYGYISHSGVREGVIRVERNMDVDYRLKIKYINILKTLG